MVIKCQPWYNGLDINTYYEIVQTRKIMAQMILNYLVNLLLFIKDWKDWLATWCLSEDSTQEISLFEVSKKSQTDNLLHSKVISDYPI